MRRWGEKGSLEWMGRKRGGGRAILYKYTHLMGKQESMSLVYSEPEGQANTKKITLFLSNQKTDNMGTLSG